MRQQYTVNYSARALYAGSVGRHRTYDNVSLPSLARFWRAINRQHGRFALVGCDDRRGVYRYAEIVMVNK